MICGAQPVPITKQQGERLEEWCKDFQYFFGWQVNVNCKNSPMVVEVNAKKFNYRVSAEGKYLGCTLDDKEEGTSCDLVHGDFDFPTFARIMIEILHWESRSRKAKSALNCTEMRAT